MKLQIQLSSCTRFDISVSTTSRQNKRIKIIQKHGRTTKDITKKKWIQVKYIIRWFKLQIDGCDARTWLHQFNFWILMWIFIWFSRVIGMEPPIAAATEGSAISYWWRPVHHRPARTYPAQLPLFVNFLLRWSMWTTAWL